MGVVCKTTALPLPGSLRIRPKTGTKIVLCNKSNGCPADFPVFDHLHHNFRGTQGQVEWCTMGGIHWDDVDEHFHPWKHVHHSPGFPGPLVQSHHSKRHSRPDPTATSLAWIWRPEDLHPGGVHMGCYDGNVQEIRSPIPYQGVVGQETAKNAKNKSTNICLVQRWTRIPRKG